MESLIELLSHPYLILNRVAEDVYGEKTAAMHQRLRSRVLGRHRFGVEEYKDLRRELLKFARQLERIAGKLDEQAADPGKANRLTQIQHPWLNHRAILEDLGRPYDLRYTAVYDRLRSRTSLPEGMLANLAILYRTFAATVQHQLEAAHEARKAYPFSQGRGGASHRKDPDKPAKPKPKARRKPATTA